MDETTKGRQMDTCDRHEMQLDELGCCEGCTYEQHNRQPHPTAAA